MELPWLVRGDFNVILNKEEKIGRLLVYPPEYEDFAFCLNSCGLFDTGYKGSPFTWWNGWPYTTYIFKGLDIILVNSPFQSIFPITKVEYLIRTSSDHAPLFMTCSDQTTAFAKPFKFSNFWTKHASFMEVVRQNWLADVTGDPFLMFKQKIKRVKLTLSKWGRLTYRDIFKQLALREYVVRIKVMLFKKN